MAVQVYSNQTLFLLDRWGQDQSNEFYLSWHVETTDTDSYGEFIMQSGTVEKIAKVSDFV